jgi:hypothetical protein
MTNNPQRNLGRSILAIFVGFLVVFVLSLAADFTMYALHIAPNPGQRMSNPLLGVAFTYRAVFAVLGSYLTARLAPFGPMLHAMIGGAIGFCIGLAGVVFTWNSPQAAGAHWYPIAVAVVAIPAAWIGGKLYREKMPVRVG